MKNLRKILAEEGLTKSAMTRNQLRRKLKPLAKQYGFELGDISDDVITELVKD